MRTRGIEFSSMLIFLMFSCFLGIGAESCLIISGIDYWIVPIISTFIGLPILLLYLYIFNNKDKLNINNLNIKLFGKKIGLIINMLLLLFIISFNMITFYNLINFVTSQYLYNTPAWFINILFIIPTIYLISRGPRIMFRTIMSLFYIFIILFIISCLGLSTQIKLLNIMPILQDGITPLLKGIIPYISYMILPLFLLLIVPKKEINDNNLNKKIIITYFIGNLFIFLIFFLVVSVFGIELTKLYQYPSYHILKRVFIGGFIERMENTLSIGWLIVLFISTMFSHYYSYRTIKDNFNINKNIIYIFVVMIMLISQFIFKNNTISENFYTHVYPYFLIFFLLIIPIITAIKLKKSNT